VNAAVTGQSVPDMDMSRGNPGAPSQIISFFILPTGLLMGTVFSLFLDLLLFIHYATCAATNKVKYAYKD